MPWIRVRRGNDDPFHSRTDNCICAWRCPSVCATRFQRHVKRCITGHPCNYGSGILASTWFQNSTIYQRFDLCMRPAGLLVPTFADDVSILDQDRANCGIRTRLTQSMPCQHQCTLHETLVLSCELHRHQNKYRIAARQACLADASQGRDGGARVGRGKNAVRPQTSLAETSWLMARLSARPATFA